MQKISCKLSLLLFILFGLFINVGSLHAGNSELWELIKILRDNGVITRQQYDLLKKAKEENRDADTTSSSLQIAPTADVTIRYKNGLEIATNDGNFAFMVGGRLMVDAGFFNEDRNPLGDGTRLNQARLEFDGKLYGDWSYALSIDFADSNVKFKNAYLRYDSFWPLTLKIGQFKEPFSLENLTSSKFITFMERALLSELTPGRNVGIGLSTSGDNWTVTGGVFGEDADDDVKNEGDEGWGSTGRITLAPVLSDTNLLHFGAAASYRVPDDRERVNFDTGPESDLPASSVDYLETGTIKEVSEIFKYGLESAVVFGPLSLQAEYVWTRVYRDQGSDDVDFDGWYVYGSWFLTGESRSYKKSKGAFGRIYPSRKAGALELALRYSVLDLNERNIDGGKEDNITVGLNWYLNPQVRWMANYIIVDNDNNADANGAVAADDDPEIFQLRFQVDF